MMDSSVFQAILRTGAGFRVDLEGDGRVDVWVFVMGGVFGCWGGVGWEIDLGVGIRIWFLCGCSSGLPLPKGRRPVWPLRVCEVALSSRHIVSPRWTGGGSCGRRWLVVRMEAGP